MEKLPGPKIVGKINLPQAKKKRVNFYYDGFNFYRGLKESNWEYYYWLDLVKFSQKLIGKYKDWEVNKVNYYTAPPFSKEKADRQRILMDCNTKLNGKYFEVKWGKYGTRTIRCSATCKEEFKHPEEKGADVGIAVDIIGDFLLKDCDVTVLVSGDNDQIPALKFINDHNPYHKILIFFPPNREKNSLRKYCYQHSHLLTSPHLFSSCILSNPVKFSDETEVAKPEKWPDLPVKKTV